MFPVLFPGHETMLGFCSFDSVVRVAEDALVRSSRRILDPVLSSQSDGEGGDGQPLEDFPV